MKRSLFLILWLGSFTSFPQDVSFSKPEQDFYLEMANPAVTPADEWSKLTKDINVCFASDNIRYPKERVPEGLSQKSWDARAWKGERIHTQILIWTKKRIPEVSFEIHDLINNKGDRIRSDNMRSGFVRYVMTDEFGRGCDERKTTEYDSSLVEDPIDIISKINVNAYTVQPIWITIKVPGEIPAGKYGGTITVNAIEKYDLKVSLTVLDHLLPPPAQWNYDLDLWQSAASIAKVHDVRLWSDEHFELMVPYFKLLASAGQKSNEDYRS